MYPKRDEENDHVIYRALIPTNHLIIRHLEHIVCLLILAKKRIPQFTGMTLKREKNENKARRMFKEGTG
jgi:hypothetical protein